MAYEEMGVQKMIPENRRGSSVAESDGVGKDRKEYTTKTED